MVEIVSTELISAIAAKNGKILVDDNYLKILVDTANRNMANNKERLKQLYGALRALK